ncbi:hypothetical protein XENOCAPTIV_027299 [Xenoophorus captivus]|uniref:CR-type domain-containing protein n=1 Tax=Xenoophorus captivus TaxID=1517983 RepID=A0ABV0RJM8_9TELE
MCMPCHGTGVQVRMHQLLPGIVQQVSTVCLNCQGQGQRISQKDRCKTCGGRKIMRQKKILEVVFPPANFLPKHKLKELERYLPEKMNPEQTDSMDEDLYIYADLEDCDLESRRRHRHQFYYMDEDDCASTGGVQCHTS